MISTRKSVAGARIPRVWQQALLEALLRELAHSILQVHRQSTALLPLTALLLQAILRAILLQAPTASTRQGKERYLPWNMVDNLHHRQKGPERI